MTGNKIKSIQRYGHNPGLIFFEIRSYFPEIASNSADTTFNLLRTADAPFS